MLARSDAKVTITWAWLGQQLRSAVENTCQTDAEQPLTTKNTCQTDAEQFLTKNTHQAAAQEPSARNKYN